MLICLIQYIYWHEVYGIYMLELICGMKDMMVWNLYAL